MILNMYALRDSKVGYLPPTFEHSDLVARRNFEHAIRTGSGLLKTHARDFTLCRLGDFDTDTAVINLLPLPDVICHGDEIDYEE